MPTLLRVRPTFTGGSGGNQVATFHFDMGLAPTQANADTVWTAVRTFWNTVRASMLSTYNINMPGEVVEIDTDTGEIEGLFPHAAETLVGSVVGEGCPWATQGLVSLRTNGIVNSRRVRGRLFLPGVPESENSNGIPAGSYSANIGPAATTLVASAAEWVVYHRPVPPAPGAPAVGGLSFPVTSATVGTKWAVLRSRRD
jgi:hypothetical protein